MPQFQVLSGKHHERVPGRGVVHYAKGDIVKSVRDLRKVFPNKFALVDERPRLEELEVNSSLKVESLGKGQYNVINAMTKRPINEKPLTKSEAEELVNVQDEEKD